MITEERESMTSREGGEGGGALSAEAEDRHRGGLTCDSTVPSFTWKVTDSHSMVNPREQHRQRQIWRCASVCQENSGLSSELEHDLLLNASSLSLSLSLSLRPRSVSERGREKSAVHASSHASSPWRPCRGRMRQPGAANKVCRNLLHR